MKQMHWSWDQLEATPYYIQMYCWDFLQRELEEENNRAKEASKPKRGEM